MTSCLHCAFWKAAGRRTRKDMYVHGTMPIVSVGEVVRAATGVLSDAIGSIASPEARQGALDFVRDSLVAAAGNPAIVQPRSDLEVMPWQ